MGGFPILYYEGVLLMIPEEKVKKEIKRLFDTAPNVHMDVTLTSPKLVLRNAEATIKRVYPHIFQIEETSSGTPKCHTLQYTDVMVGNIVILEMNG